MVGAAAASRRRRRGTKQADGECQRLSAMGTARARARTSGSRRGESPRPCRPALPVAGALRAPPAPLRQAVDSVWTAHSCAPARTAAAAAAAVGRAHENRRLCELRGARHGRCALHDRHAHLGVKQLDGLLVRALALDRERHHRFALVQKDPLHGVGAVRVLDHVAGEPLDDLEESVLRFQLQLCRNARGRVGGVTGTRPPG